MTKEMWQLARMHELKDFGERLSHYENDEMLIDEVDEGFCNMMGYTQSELMIRSCGKVGDLIYPPDYEEIRYQIRKNLKQSGSYTCRYRMRKKTVHLSGCVKTDAMKKMIPEEKISVL